MPGDQPKSANGAAAWYWRRGWIEQSSKDTEGRLGLSEVRVGCQQRLSRSPASLTTSTIVAYFGGVAGDRSAARTLSVSDLSAR